MKQRFTAYPQSGIKAGSCIYSASNISDFEITEDGVLAEYTGPGRDVVIPGSVTTIGDKAFYGCASLKSITIPDSVTSIAVNAFEGCNKLPQDVKNYISQFYYDDSSKFFSDNDNDDEYDDDEMSFNEWYDSSQGEVDGEEFVEKLENLVRSNYNVDDFFEEPSTQRYQGGDFIWITLSDGSKYEFEFDWYDEQFSIYEDGPEAAAKSYFKEIQEGIDSGSALVE